MRDRNPYSIAKDSIAGAKLPVLVIPASLLSPSAAQLDSASCALVQTLAAAAFPSLSRLKLSLSEQLACAFSAYHAFPVPASSFFAALPRLPAPLKELELSMRDELAPDAVQLLAQLPCLATLRLPCSSLLQDEVQLLADMPSLRELSVRDMRLETDVDVSRCAWELLELPYLALQRGEELLLPLRPGLILNIGGSLEVHLGPAATQAQAEASAIRLAKATARLASCIFPSANNAVTLRWDEIPSDSVETAGILLTLAPLASAFPLYGVYL